MIVGLVLRVLYYTNILKKNLSVCYNLEIIITTSSLAFVFIQWQLTFFPFENPEIIRHLFAPILRNCLIDTFVLFHF